MIKTSSQIRVRFAETDAMGVVYHANYLHWFEVARVHLMDSIGLPYIDLANQGTHLPVIEAHVNYKSPAKFDDKVDILAFIKDTPSLRIKIHYEVTCKNNLLCTGHTTHVFINEKGMPIKPPKHFIDSLKKLFDEKKEK